MSGSVPVAEEVMQNRLLALMERPSGFDPAKGGLGAYLFGITRKISQNWASSRAMPSVITSEYQRVAIVLIAAVLILALSVMSTYRGP